MAIFIDVSVVSAGTLRTGGMGSESRNLVKPYSLNDLSGEVGTAVYCTYCARDGANPTPAGSLISSMVAFLPLKVPEAIGRPTLHGDARLRSLEVLPGR